MARIAIPERLLSALGPEMKMDTHWVDVRLHDARQFNNLVVRGGWCITGRDSDLNGYGALPFESEHIARIRRRALLGSLWPFWPSVGRRDA
jgi:hypothetical protein